MTPTAELGCKALLQALLVPTQQSKKNHKHKKIYTLATKPFRYTNTTAIYILLIFTCFNKLGQ